MNSKIKLGVNIDHVATVRNARGTIYPSPLKAAILAQESKADSVTIHIREDRRHIRERDLVQIKNKVKIPINLEMAPTLSMLSIALKHKPDYVCIVPEKRQEVTTEGGLNLKKNKKKIKPIINELNKLKIRTSLFIDPSIKNIKLSKQIGAKCIEIHTGKISNLVKKNKNYQKEFFKIKKTVKYAKSLDIEIHAGHGSDYKTTKILKRIKEIKEYNIGHFIIGESIQYGLKNVIKKFKKILNKK